MTINGLGVSPALARTLGNTSTIEAANSVARTKMRNVKRCRDGAMAERWTAAGCSNPSASSGASTATRLPKFVDTMRTQHANVSSVDAAVA